MGKINNMVGGTVTHTTTLKINKRKRRCYRPGARQEVELESTVLGKLYLCYLIVRLSEVKLHNRETAIEVTRGARTPQRLYVPPTPQSEHGGLLGLEQGCHHLLAISTNCGKG